MSVPGDHTDSPYGYTHVSISIENHPDVNVSEILDQLHDVVHDVCEAPEVKDEDGVPMCSFEHYESGRFAACLFPDEGEPNLQHVAVHEVKDET